MTVSLKGFLLYTACLGAIFSFTASQSFKGLREDNQRLRIENASLRQKIHQPSASVITPQIAFEVVAVLQKHEANQGSSVEKPQLALSNDGVIAAIWVSTRKNTQCVATVAYYKPWQFINFPTCATILNTP